MPKPKTKAMKIIRYIYMYLVTAISIVLIIISSIGLIRLVLEEYVFDVKSYEELRLTYFECGESDTFLDSRGTALEGNSESVDLSPQELEKCKARVDENRRLQHINNVKRDLVTWISMLLVALPLYLYHWGLIQKENKK